MNVLLLLLILTIGAFFGGSEVNAEAKSEAELNAALIEMEYPLEVIEELPVGLRQELVENKDDGFIFHSHESITIPIFNSELGQISPFSVDEMSLSVTASENSSGVWSFAPSFTWEQPNPGITSSFNNDTFAFMLPPNDWSITSTGTPSLTVYTEIISGVSEIFTVNSPVGASFNGMTFEKSGTVPGTSYAVYYGYTSFQATPLVNSPQEQMLMGYAKVGSSNVSYSLSVSGFGFSWTPLSQDEYVNTYINF